MDGMLCVAEEADPVYGQKVPGLFSVKAFKIVRDIDKGAMLTIPVEGTLLLSITNLEEKEIVHVETEYLTDNPFGSVISESGLEATKIVLRVVQYQKKISVTITEKETPRTLYMEYFEPKHSAAIMKLFGQVAQDDEGIFDLIFKFDEIKEKENGKEG